MLYSDIELVITRSKTLEARLRRILDAQGTGLGQLAHSVRGKLPRTTFQQLQEVFKIRNRIVHDVGQNKLENRIRFEQLCHDIERSLDRLENPSQALARDLGCLIIAFIVALMIYFLLEGPL